MKGDAERCRTGLTLTLAKEAYGRAGGGRILWALFRNAYLGGKRYKVVKNSIENWQRKFLALKAEEYKEK